MSGRRSATKPPGRHHITQQPPRPGGSGDESSLRSHAHRAAAGLTAVHSGAASSHSRSDCRGTRSNERRTVAGQLTGPGSALSGPGLPRALRRRSGSRHRGIARSRRGEWSSAVVAVDGVVGGAGAGGVVDVPTPPLLHRRWIEPAVGIARQGWTRDTGRLRPPHARQRLSRCGRLRCSRVPRSPARTTRPYAVAAPATAPFGRLPSRTRVTSARGRA
jgi:hypothetical protein